MNALRRRWCRGWRGRRSARHRLVRQRTCGEAVGVIGVDPLPEADDKYVGDAVREQVVRRRQFARRARRSEPPSHPRARRSVGHGSQEQPIRTYTLNTHPSTTTGPTKRGLRRTSSNEARQNPSSGRKPSAKRLIGWTSSQDVIQTVDQAAAELNPFAWNNSETIPAD